MEVSFSKVTAFRRCKQKYYWAYVRKLKKKRLSLAPARGVLLHQSLANMYSGKPWVDPIAAFEKEFLTWFAEEREAYGDLPGEAYRIMKSYVANWMGVDAGIKTIATELDKTVDFGDFELRTIIDWIFEDKDGLWICDHKTVSSVPNETYQLTDLQQTIYWLAAQVLGFRPTGVVTNYISTTAPTIPKVLNSGQISRDKRIRTDVATFVKALKANGQDPADYDDVLEAIRGNVFFKRYKLPRTPSLVTAMWDDFQETVADIAVTEHRWATKPDRIIAPRSFMNRVCNWDCDYAPLCLASLQGDVSEIIRTDYEEAKADADGQEEEGSDRDA